jgi:hypothetical protein
VATSTAAGQPIHATGSRKPFTRRTVFNHVASFRFAETSMVGLPLARPDLQHRPIAPIATSQHHPQYKTRNLVRGFCVDCMLNMRVGQSTLETLSARFWKSKQIAISNDSFRSNQELVSEFLQASSPSKHRNPPDIANPSKYRRILH